MTNDKPESIKPTRLRYRQPPELSPSIMRPVTLSLIGCSTSQSSRSQSFPVMKLWEPQHPKGRRVLRLLRRLEVDRLITGKQIGNCHDLVVTLLAGEEAQRRFDPKSIRKHHAAGDYHSAKELLMRLHPDEEECRYAFRYLLARTRNLVSNPRNWRQIKDLAKALLERRTLTGEEVDNVIQGTDNAQLEERNARKK